MPDAGPPDRRLSFWELRARLWSAAHDHDDPFRRPYDDEIDYELARIMQEAGITTARVRLQGYSGLAQHELVAPLRPLFGEDYRPYRELRKFWLPYAAISADFYADAVGRQPDAKTLADAVRSCHAALELAVRQHEDLYRIWSKSPFRKTLPDPIEFYNSFDEKGREVREALKSLEALIRHAGPQPSSRADVWTWTFTDIFARAFFRFTSTVPGALAGSIKSFRKFVEAAWVIISDHESAETRGDRVFRNILREDHVLGQRIHSLSDLLEVTELSLAAIIEAGPFEGCEKVLMKDAVYSAYMCGGLHLLSSAGDEEQMPL